MAWPRATGRPIAFSPRRKQVEQIDSGAGREGRQVSPVTWLGGGFPSWSCVRTGSGCLLSDPLSLGHVLTTRKQIFRGKGTTGGVWVDPRLPHAVLCREHGKSRLIGFSCFVYLVSV